MIDEGLFERFPVDAVYGMHNAPGLPVGAFATRKGPFMAASDAWTVTFRGSGGHGGAGAHLATDPTLAVGQFVAALQTIVSRSVPATETAVVSVGHIAAGDRDAPNIIPAEAVVSRHRARSYAPAIRDLIETRLRATRPPPAPPRSDARRRSTTTRGCSRRSSPTRPRPTSPWPRRARWSAPARSPTKRRR